MDSIDLHSVKKIVSVRGDLLTVRRDNYVWVIRAGPDPRSWRKRINRRGDGIGPWQQARPPFDELLRCPEAFPPTAAAAINEFSLQKNRSSRPEAVEGPTATGPFPWACRPKEGERLRRWSRLHPDDFHMNFDGRIPHREIDRLPVGMHFHCGVAVPFSVSNEGLWHLRSTIRLVRLLRQQLPAWAALFPDGAIDFVERHRFKTRRWHLLNLWLRVPGGRELWDDIPALAWLASSSWLCRIKSVQRPFRSLRALVQKPRACLLEWLDLPPGKGTLSLLRSLDPTQMTPRFKHLVLKVLRCDDKRRAWQNLPSPVGARELSILAYDEPVSFPILRLINRGAEVVGRGRRESVEYLVSECLQMIKHLGLEMLYQPALARINSAVRLLEFHDELVALTNKSSDGGWWPASPIQPPFEPAHWMTPLGTRESLIAEGIVMNHCVASYASHVLQGRYYCYAISLPKYGRATLGLLKAQDGAWRIAEIRGKSNEPVPSSLWDLVYEWLLEEDNHPTSGSDCPTTKIAFTDEEDLGEMPF